MWNWFIVIIVAAIMTTEPMWKDQAPEYVPKRKRWTWGHKVWTRVLRDRDKLLEWMDRKAYYGLLNTKVKNKRRVPLGRRTTPGVATSRGRQRIFTVLHSTSRQGNHCQWDSDSKPIRVDNCATRSISNDISDFVTAPVPMPGYSIGGIGGRLNQCMTGTIHWTIQDDEGKSYDLILPNSIYAPKSPVRILSAQHWAQEANDNYPKPRGTWCATYADCVQLQWKQRTRTRTLPLERSGTNVATIYTAPGYSRFEAFITQAGTSDEDLMCYDAAIISDEEGNDRSDEMLDDEDGYDAVEHAEKDSDNTDDTERKQPLVTDFDLQGPTDGETTVNIITDEEDSQYKDTSAEFLRWHHRLGHISPKKIRIMASLGYLPKRLSRCRVPLCTSCLFGKATKRPWRTKTSKAKADLENITKPGQCVSVDQLESTVPGLVAQLKGIPTKKRYGAATVFVDHHSGLSYVHLQSSTTAEETLEAKHAFERYAKSCGIHVLHYHADNGRFAEKLWTADCLKQGQGLTFCGAYAHHQNGVAESKIRELQEHARTMLIHAAKRWPEAINAHLWPYAIRTANDILNATWNLKRKLVPLEEFSGTKVGDNLKHWSHFGCPVYVLDRRLASGKKISKWMERSRVAIYLGRSPNHAKSVALCLSLTTGLASPQFHYKLDPTFQTMRKAFRHRIPESHWQKCCHFSRGTDAKRFKLRGVPASQVPPAGGPGPEEEHHDSRWMRSRNEQPSNSNEPTAADDLHEVEDGENPPAGEPQGLRRSTRVKKPPDRLHQAFVMEAFLCESEVAGSNGIAYEALKQIDDDDCEMQCMAASSDPDIMYLHEALREPDRDQFIQAMVEEVQGQSDNGNWTLVPLSQVPEGATILPAVWAMRRKRRIKTNEVYKWKARLNLDGSKMVEGKDYWHTYSAVIQWPPVRLLMILSLVRKWYTVQVDYVQAYPQAKAEFDHVYMKVPKGFEVPGADKDEYVLKIEKNIYGGKAAGRVWNEHLIAKLRSIGFVPSDYDDCILYKGTIVYALYVDDSILAGPNLTEIEEAIQQMRGVGLDLTVEGDVSDFLGVNVTRKDDGTIHLTQPHLVEKILADLRLTGNDTAIKRTPAKVKQLLKRFRDSEPFDGHFNYRSVIGKMLYLEKSTRPDLAYAVHQCARFSSDPKEEHGKAVKWLGRYLSGSRDKGLIFKPNEEGLVCWVDADFSGNWDSEGAPETDPDTARSRTGYVITYAGCPLVWTSKLQTIVSLSTTEAEYVALSTAMRELIPLMHIMKEMRERGHDIPGAVPKIRCRVFEDNSGALEMANNPKYRPRTKHLNCRFHHFREHVKDVKRPDDDDDCKASIEKIDTKDQRADYLTKPLDAEEHEKHRQSVQGW